MEELRLSEIRPQHVREGELRVGGLPEQEIADAEFPAGTDDEVGIRDPRGVEAEENISSVISSGAIPPSAASAARRRAARTISLRPAYESPSVRVISVFPAVADTVCSSTCRTANGREEVSPMTRRRIRCRRRGKVR